jgi:hypothetical protein
MPQGLLPDGVVVAKQGFGPFADVAIAVAALRLDLVQIVTGDGIPADVDRPVRLQLVETRPDAGAGLRRQRAVRPALGVDDDGLRRVGDGDLCQPGSSGSGRCRRFQTRTGTAARTAAPMRAPGCRRRAGRIRRSERHFWIGNLSIVGSGLGTTPASIFIWSVMQASAGTAQRFRQKQSGPSISRSGAHTRSLRSCRTVPPTEDRSGRPPCCRLRRRSGWPWSERSCPGIRRTDCWRRR